jgi:DNA repair exonuclease SbcCD ATPase subunit
MGSNGNGKSLVKETEITVRFNPNSSVSVEELSNDPKVITLERLNDLQERYNIIGKYCLEVKTQNGFKKVKAIGITSPNSEKIKVKTEFYQISGSPMHRVIKNGEWIFLKDLVVGDEILTENGYREIKMLESDGVKEDLWDIEVEGEEYYSNGIVSHNSSLISSFDYSLFGKCKGNKKKWATLGNLPNRINGGDMSVKIKFKSGESEVEVSRGISPNFLKLLENGMENERAGKANLDEKIEKYVGMDIETFKSFISLSINDFKNFISLSNEEKQILLDKLFNLEVINILSNILKDLNKANKLQLTKFDSEISTLNESIESIKRSIQKAVEQEKKNIQLEIEEIKKMMDSKKEEYQTLKEKVEKIKGKELELKSEIDREKEKFITLNGEIRTVQKEIDLYNSGKCPTCGTNFDDDHYHNLKGLLLEKKSKIEGIKLEVETSITNIKERMLKLESIKDSTNTSFNDLNYLLKNYKVQIDKLNLQKGNDSGNSVNVVEFENSIKELEAKKEVSKESETICRDKELYYKELNKIFGEDGVRRSIISGIIKPINHFINENISKMNLPFRVELDETFTANIKQFGSPIEHDSLSTGETKLLNLSILIAYLKLIRTKKTINVLFLDEVFSSIDIENIEKILNLLKSFATEYKINIFVVHHALMNEELFDRIVKIDKNIFTEINIIKS